MAEIQSPYKDLPPEEAVTETDISDRWLYMLGCIFFASPGFGSGAYRYEFNYDLRLRFQEAEANTLLVSIAAAVRRRTELLDDFERSQIAQVAPASVGSLVKDIRQKERSVDLSFREACNKIIHAKQIKFDYDERTCRRGGVLNPTVHCYGTHGKLEWKASIQIYSFIKAAWDHG